MCHAEAQGTPSSSIETESVSLSWLAYIEKGFEEEQKEGFPDATVVAHYGIIRDLLLAPDDDNGAVPRAIGSFHNNYNTGFFGEDFGLRKPPEYAAGDVLNSITLIIFEIVEYVPFTDIRHDRLANVLIGLKSSAAQVFQPDDPHFVYYGWGLESAASESWNGGQANAWTQDNEWRTAVQASNSWVNTSALLAKLFKAGLLDSDGPLWISGDFENALEKSTYGDYATNIGRKAQVFAVANYILIAGDALVKETKTPSQKWWFELSAKKWNPWASKLQEVADAVSEGAEWDLKTKALEAHDKVVELYPEAFEESE